MNDALAQTFIASNVRLAYASRAARVNRRVARVNLYACVKEVRTAKDA